MRKIKLFVDAHPFDKEHQGTRTFIKRLYLELWKLRPDIELYFGARDIENLKEEFREIEGCRFIQYRFSGTVSRLLFEIPFIVYKYKIDLAHFQYISALIKNCRQVVTTHDVLFNDFKEEFSFFYRVTRNILFRYSLKNADVKTTVSQYSKQSIQKHFKIPPDDIYVTPNSIAKESLAAFDKAHSKKYIKDQFNIPSYILYVSRFEPRKNHVQLLRAYLDLKLYLKGYHLVMLGHPSIKTPAFDRLLAEQPAEIRKFIFTGSSVKDADMQHFYRGAEVFIYPSKAEGFGLPPVEAGALRIPVICSNTTAMRDFSFFGEYHLDPGDYGLFCRKLDQMINALPEQAQLDKVAEDIFRQYSQALTAGRFNEAISKYFPAV